MFREVPASWWAVEGSQTLPESQSGFWHSEIYLEEDRTVKIDKWLSCTFFCFCFGKETYTTTGFFHFGSLSFNIGHLSRWKHPAELRHQNGNVLSGPRKSRRTTKRECLPDMALNLKCGPNNEMSVSNPVLLYLCSCWAKSLKIQIFILFLEGFWLNSFQLSKEGRDWSLDRHIGASDEIIKSGSIIFHPS